MGTELKRNNPSSLEGNNNVEESIHNFACTIMSWNIHSLKRRYHDVLYYTRRKNPAIVCLQEALHGNNPFRINGYTKYEHNTQQGLVTYINNKLPHEHVENSTSFNNNCGNTYMLFRINLKDNPFYVCNVYIESNKFDENRLPDPLIYEDTIFAGDFNAKHESLSPPNNNTTNGNGRKFLQFTMENNMNILGSKLPTHIRGGRLDYIIISGLQDAEFDSRRIDTMISDHWAIECTLSLNLEMPPPYERRRINIPVEFVALFRSFMSSTFRGEKLDELNSQYIHDKLLANIHFYHDNYINRSTITKKVTSRSDWVDDDKLVKFEEQVSDALNEYQIHGNVETLTNYLIKIRDSTNLKSDIRKQYFHKFLQGLNAHTSQSKVWQGFNSLMGKRKTIAQSKDAIVIAHDLLNQYSLTSTFSNLPHDVQVRLDEHKFNRLMKIEIACAQTHEEDRFINYITKTEIDIALSHGKSTAPGEDGITYQVIRYLNDNICDGINPIQSLFSAVYKEGLLPWQWKYSIIIPVPKRDSNQFRPISLTSCLCKVFERIILNRLQFTLSGKLTDNLYGFMKGKSTKDCFIEFMNSESHTGVTTFLDLKSAFDIANRTVIMEHLVDLGVKGTLLEIIRSYFTDRFSKVYYKGYVTPTAKEFELGTPQGGVLSPFLFNILIDKLIKSITLPNHNCIIICYADDICIRTPTMHDMQTVMDQITELTKDLGLIISIPKTKLQCNTNATEPLSIDGQPLETCTPYKYLGIPTPLPEDYINNLCDRLSQRLKPLKVLANRIAGVNIHLCRTFYIAYIRSLVDYNALHICTLNKATLNKLEKIQNKAMRIILGCPMSTRIIAMRNELNLAPLTEHVKQVAILYGVKLAKSCINTDPRLDNEVQHSPTAPAILQSLIKGETVYNINKHPKIFRLITSGARKHNVNLFTENGNERQISINPSERISAKIHFPQLPSKSDNHNSIIQKTSWLESFESTLDKNFLDSSPIHIYTDGSHISKTGKSGCGLIAYDSPGGNELFKASVAQPKWTTNCESEIFGLRLGVRYAIRYKRNAIIICDSKSALLALNSGKTSYRSQIDAIQRDLIFCSKNELKVQFMWVPAHVGIEGNERADALAKTGSRKQSPREEVISVKQMRTILKTETNEEHRLTMEYERLASSSLKHYKKFINHKHFYGKGKLHTGPCDRIAAKIRLGYRNIWELNFERTGGTNSEYSSCVLCKSPNANKLLHYICYCPELEPFRPKGMQYHQLCIHFCKPETLYPILCLHPGLKM